MTPKQMLRAMRKWGISVVAWQGLWLAGECESMSVGGVGIFNFRQAGSYHSGETPEIAVEDYCNARDLEWDV